MKGGDGRGKERGRVPPLLWFPPGSRDARIVTGSNRVCIDSWAKFTELLVFLAALLGLPVRDFTRIVMHFSWSRVDPGLGCCSWLRSWMVCDVMSLAM